MTPFGHIRASAQFGPVWPSMTRFDPVLHCFAPKNDDEPIIQDDPKKKDKPKQEEGPKKGDNTKNNDDPKMNTNQK